MKKLIVVLAVLFAWLCAFGRDQANANDGKTLLRACSITLDVNVYHPHTVKGEREAFDLGFCLGVFKGVYTSSSGQDFCPGSAVPIKDGLELTVKFIKDHPELQEKDAADIVRWTLAEKFPCKAADHKVSSACLLEKSAGTLAQNITADYIEGKATKAEMTAADKLERDAAVACLEAPNE